MFESKHINPETWMREPVVVVDSDENQRLELCGLVEAEHYKTTALNSLANLEGTIIKSGCQIILVDLDTLPVDNLLFRDIRKKNPAVRIIGISSRPFHPELQEAMSKYIYVNLSRPIDGDELIYWLKSICENDSDSRDPPRS
jgi:DNA-binding NtrC family response regulator